MAKPKSGMDMLRDASDAMNNPMQAKKRAAKKGSAPHLKPKGKRGKAQVARIGRTYKTGGFKKIEKSAAKEYGSEEAGERVAGAIFNKMAKGKRGARKAKAKKTC